MKPVFLQRSFDPEKEGRRNLLSSQIVREEDGGAGLDRGRVPQGGATMSGSILAGKRHPVGGELQISAMRHHR
jgi:hypothetical protein